MQESDKQKFAELLRAAFRVYDKTVDTMVLRIYWGACERYTIDEVINAVSAHIQNPDTGQFLPKPADIIRQIEGGSTEKAQLAWSKVDKAVQQIGPYRSVVFDDAVIHSVIDEMGGWISFGNKGGDEWPFVANEFIKRYAAYAGRGGTQNHIRVLTGIADRDNNALTQGGKNEPRLIGDPEKCRLVYQNGNKNQQLSQDVSNVSVFLEGVPKLKMVEGGR